MRRVLIGLAMAVLLAAGAAAIATLAAARSAEAADDRGRSAEAPTRFEPSEEVSADESVPFPVDI